MKHRNTEPFYISTKDDCRYCKLAKSALTARNLGYIEAELDANGLQALKDRGYKTVPQIWHGATHVGGFEDLVKYLNEHFPE